jgi:Ni/Co efflux regulator RcnB
VEIAMTRLLISTAFAGLLAFGGTALAQDDHRGDRGDDRGGRAAQPAKPAPAAPAAPAPKAGPANAPRGPSQGGGFMNFGATGNTAKAAPAARGSDENRQGRAMNNSPANNPAPSAAMRGPSSNNGNNRGGNDNRGNNDNRGGNDNRAGNDRRGQGSRTDFSAYHRNFSAPHRYRAPSYHRPSGWYAHRWTFGEVLPAMFWAPDYWLNDYRDYDLPLPPPGTVWVRDGDDALLIDRYSGEIIQVEYSVFY